MRSFTRQLLAVAVIASGLALAPAHAETSEGSEVARIEGDVPMSKHSAIDDALSEYAAPKDGKKRTYRVREYGGQKDKQVSARKPLKR